MPIYSYKCQACCKVEDRFRSIARMREPALCQCGGESIYLWAPTKAGIIGCEMRVEHDGVVYEGTGRQISARLAQQGVAFKSDYIDKTAPQTFGADKANREPPKHLAPIVKQIMDEAARAKRDGRAAEMAKRAEAEASAA